MVVAFHPDASVSKPPRSKNEGQQRGGHGPPREASDTGCWRPQQTREGRHKRGDGSGACALCSRHIKLGHSEREVIIYDWKVNNNHTLAGRTRRPTLWLNPANTPSSRHPTAPSHGKLSRDVPMADAKARKRPRVEWTAVEAVDGARVVYNRPCQNRPRTDARSFLETWSTWS